MYKLSIIIPIFNEEQRLGSSFQIIKKFFQKKLSKDIEVVFVNDGSTDKTDQILKKFIKQNSKKIKLNYINYKLNKGKGFAVKKGVLASKNSWILVCDADMSVLPGQFDIWYKKGLIKENNIAYYGSRIHKNSKVKALFLRKLFGGVLSLLLSLLFHIKLSDTQCGFKVFNSKYIKKIFREIKCNGYAYDVEITLLLKKRKIKIIELPLKWKHKSGSKVSLIKDSIKIFCDLIILRLK